MKKIFFLVITILLCSFGLTAQSQITRGITGRILLENTNEPVPQANIRVLRQSDSTFVTGKASEMDGKFSIPVNNGSYIVHVSFIGFHDLYKNVSVSSSTPMANLGDLVMSADNILLSETVVTAKAPEIVVKGDTLEYNADSYKVTESAVVEDLLKKMPGVEIDSEGNITVNGKSISKILVDGEEFFSDDPKVASKNLPAKMVEKLQVLERRTEISQMTGFDDGEEENVINLTVCSVMKEGLFGNGFTGYESKDRYEANAMVNYMRNNDQYTIIGVTNNTNNAGFSDLGTAMFGSMGGFGGRGGGFGSRDGITTSANIGGNFSKDFTKKFKLGGNVRYGYGDTEVTSEVFTQKILSSDNNLKIERNTINNISQDFHMDLRIECKPNTSTTKIFRPNVSFYNISHNETGKFNTIQQMTSDTYHLGESVYM